MIPFLAYSISTKGTCEREAGALSCGITPSISNQAIPRGYSTSVCKMPVDAKSIRTTFEGTESAAREIRSITSCGEAVPWSLVAIAIQAADAPFGGDAWERYHAGEKFSESVLPR